MKRIRLTESQLRRVINETINEALGEGQGFNAFKSIMKGMPQYKKGIGDFAAEMKDEFGSPENRQAYKNYINMGSGTGDYSRDMYNDEGEAEKWDPGAYNQKPVNRGLSGKIGRASAVGASIAAGAGRAAYNSARNAFRRGK